jgi:hypothetical protein
LRAAFTSQRCCSAACAVFFERDAPPVEETPQRPDADTDAARLQLLLKLDERDVRRLGDLAKEKGSFGFYTARLTVAALLLCRDVALLLQPVHRLAARKTMFNGIHHAAAKINRKSLGHACRHSPACILNQKRADLGIPDDSFRWENALAVCGKTGKFEVLPFRCGAFCG